MALEHVDRRQDGRVEARDLAARPHRVARVGQEVQHHLLERVGVAPDRGQPRRQGAPERDAVADDLLLDQEQGLVHQAVEVHAPVGARGVAGERQEALRDARDALGVAVDHVQVFAHVRGQRARLGVELHQLGARRDDADRVVELVGEARRQRAERRELLGLAGGALDADALGDVLDQHDHARGPRALPEQAPLDVLDDRARAQALVLDALLRELLDLAAQQPPEALRPRLPGGRGEALEVAASGDLGGRHVVARLHGPVPGHDPPVGVEREHALAQVVHDALDEPLAVQDLGGERRPAQALALLDLGEDAHADGRAEQDDEPHGDVGDLQARDGRPDDGQVGRRRHAGDRHPAPDAVVVRLQRGDQRQRQVEAAARPARQGDQDQREELVEEEDVEVQPERRRRPRPERRLHRRAVDEEAQRGQQQGLRLPEGRRREEDPGQRGEDRQRAQQRQRQHPGAPDVERQPVERAGQRLGHAPSL